MELVLKVLALDDAQIGILELSDDRLEDGRDEGATEVAIKAIGIYLEGCHKSGEVLSEGLELSKGSWQVTSFLQLVYLRQRGLP